MTSIFYDLETTDKDPIGQILNYSFIAVNDQYAVVSELSGIIRISPLELPRAGAILANRVNVIDHQKEAKDTEREAMQKIATWINELTDKSRGKIPLVGYNSSRFDLTYLRTSMIRNGVNPYFYGKVINRDLLHCVRKLSITRDDFPRAPYDKKETPAKLSLKLETITRELGLLKGVQTHESRDDVLLTIKLAQKLLSDFDLDVRTYDSYEARALCTDPALTLPHIAESLSPQYDLNEKEISVATPLSLHSANDRAAIWVNLARFKECGNRSALFYASYNSAALYLGSDLNHDPQLKEIALKASKAFADINPDNFFNEATCDIEQHIYRLPFQWIDKLGSALCSSTGPCPPELKKNRDAYILYIRSKLRNICDPLAQSDESTLQVLKQYANHRYSGSLQLVKELPDEQEQNEEKKDASHFTPTLSELYQEVESELSTRTDKGDHALLLALKTFYDQSPINALIDNESRGEALSA